jgi:predicted nicotinamide N-methyase
MASFGEERSIAMHPAIAPLAMMATMDFQRREWIVSQTVIATPELCPELELRLITETCPLWTAGASDLERLGLPDPFWAFAWPGGQALARHLLDHPELARGRRVLDLGAGSALQALAALKAGARAAVAADVDPFALEAAQLNAALNGLELDVVAEDLLGAPPGGFDLVLAGDMFYDSRLAARLWTALTSLQRAGALVLVGDPGRGMLPESGLSALAEYETPADADGGGRACRTRVFALA